MFSATVNSVNKSGSGSQAIPTVAGLNKAGPCDTAEKIKANAACRAR